MIAFLCIDHIAVASLAISDPSGGVNPDAGIAKLPVDLRKGTKMIITLNENRMLRTGHRPARPPSEGLKVLTLIRKDGQLNVIGPEGDSAEGEQVDLFRGQLRQEVIRLPSSFSTLA